VDSEGTKLGKITHNCGRMAGNEGVRRAGWGLCWCEVSLGSIIYALFCYVELYNMKL
jgi:hypothetical protein